MRINNNMMAMNTHRQMGVTATAQSKSMEKLSSGYRINRASDDAAVLSISEKMRGQIRGLQQA
jgi:flagellin